MSVFEQIKYQPMKLEKGNWVPHSSFPLIENYPAIFFTDGEPFREANRWARDKFESSIDLKTINRQMKHLNNYVSWLEENKLHWKHFPQTKRDRCLVRYRGYLMKKVKSGDYQCSTAKTNMATVLQFYRFAQARNLINSDSPLWKDKTKTIQFYDPLGFSRTMNVMTSELSIPCRKQAYSSVEGGLLPITGENREKLLNFLYDTGKEQLYLMHTLGFFCGLRSETIRTLTIETVENAIDDPLIPQFKTFQVGSGTKVKTKYNVSGWILIHETIWEKLVNYYYSDNAIFRRLKADDKNKNIIFLTSFGNPYGESTFTKLMSDLRVELVEKGLSQFGNFKFHQSRATYGTMLMKIMLESLPPSNAIAFVRDAMLHKNESTTWGYIKFLETTEAKAQFADEFFHFFTQKDKSANEQYIDQLINHET